MKEFIPWIFLAFGFVFGWMGGANWIQTQWLHCAKNNVVMRVAKKYYFEIKQITEEEV